MDGFQDSVARSSFTALAEVFSSCEEEINTSISFLQGPCNDQSGHSMTCFVHGSFVGACVRAWVRVGNKGTGLIASHACIWLSLQNSRVKMFLFAQR